MTKEQTQEYYNALRGRLIPFNQELNRSYIETLKLLITFAGTVFIGSVSFAHYLELLSTTYTAVITSISWGFLIISIFSLILTLVSFLCYNAKSYSWLISEVIALQKWFQNPNENFVPHLEDKQIFLPNLIAIIGFVSFMLGFLNFAMVLLNKFICICPVALILANVLIIILSYLCLKPFLKVRNNRID